jgi:pantetheine-phosphate adenylyltransferase
VTVAVLPASFDPITCGHVDVITRAARLFERLIVAVYAHTHRRKNVLFDLEERLAMVRESVAGLSNVDVLPFDGLIVDFAREQDARVIVRGLRAVSDFEYEFQHANLNRKMAPGLEVICMFASLEYGPLSSSIVKEIAENGGDTREMVPEPVGRRFREIFSPSIHRSPPEEVAP